MQPHTRPPLSTACLVLALAAGGYSLYLWAVAGAPSAEIATAAFALLAVGEIINYLARIAADLEAVAREAHIATARRLEAEAAAKLAAEADRVRDEVRDQAQRLAREAR